MKLIRQGARPVGCLLAIHMLIICGPLQSTYAAMIATETLLDGSRGLKARAYLEQFLARHDVQAALIAQGIDHREAQERINSLSDAEAVYVAEKIEQLPAGGGFFELLLIVAFLVFLILLLTDIAGYTDIFPFVHSSKK